MTFPRVINESGLTKIELAALFGVSRQTIFAWEQGKTPKPKLPHSRGSAFYPVGRFESITQALVKLIDLRQLPWAAMDKTVRASRITKMADKLAGLKPAPAR